MTRHCAASGMALRSGCPVHVVALVDARSREHGEGERERVRE